MTASSDVSARLARFVVEHRWEDVPQAVRAKGVRAILNGVGTALGGAQDQATLRMTETLRPFSAAATHTVMGHAQRTDMLNAAYLNAVATNVFDFDDTHEGTIIHPTAPVAPALFAYAEGKGVCGQDLLHAFLLGVEVVCRVGNAVSPAHYRRGWHITASCGVFGAAAAIGKLIGLNQKEMIWALGNASAQASGLVETLGTMAKSVGVGNAARNGILAALMARQGVEGPATPLEGPLGFLNVTCDAPDLSCLVDKLGVTWEIDRNFEKPYPCGVVLNSVIDASLIARADVRVSPEAIETITVFGHPLLKERADRPDVGTGRESQVSAQHAIAVTLLQGKAGVEEFSDKAVSDAENLALRKVVRPIEIDETMVVNTARLEVRLKSGEQVDVNVDHATGSPAKPMSDADLEVKFKALCAYGAPGVAAQALLDQLWAMESSLDATGFLARTRPAG